MTVRTLVLLRHAKAAHPDGVPDADRSLTPRGHADAAVAGAWLAGEQLVPDLVLCSPARRTRETWHGVALALGAGATGTTVAYDPGVYNGSAGSVLDLISATGADVTTLLVIGHNPTMLALSGLLDPAGSGDNLRTCGIAVHQVPEDWSGLRPGGAPLTATHTPRA